jgi:hypothetical protein
MADQFQSDILARLSVLEEAWKSSKPGVPPIIDPTANVLSLVAADAKRQDDLREQADKFQEKLSTQRAEFEKEAKRAEAGRIDALLAANTNNVALALEKQGAQAQAQDKRIAALEQNQYEGAGEKGQRGESRQQYQWLVMVIIALLAALAGHLWK